MVLCWCSILSVANEFEVRLPYNTSLHGQSFNRQSFNFIIVINHLKQPIKFQPVLGKVLNKSQWNRVNQPYENVTKALFEQGYQLIVVTYLNKNEWVGPAFNHHHLYLKYPIRRNVKTLNSERNIFKHAFSMLDQFVAKENQWRPLCIVFQLPPETIYSLERKHDFNTISYEQRRDFSLVNLYHEIHRRRYIYPNKLLVYPSLTANHAYLINNK